MVDIVEGNMYEYIGEMMDVRNERGMKRMIVPGDKLVKLHDTMTDKMLGRNWFSISPYDMKVDVRHRATFAAMLTEDFL